MKKCDRVASDRRQRRRGRRGACRSCSVNKDPFECAIRETCRDVLRGPTHERRAGHNEARRTIGGDAGARVARTLPARHHHRDRNDARHQAAEERNDEIEPLRKDKQRPFARTALAQKSRASAPARSRSCAKVSPASSAPRSDKNSKRRRPVAWWPCVPEEQPKMKMPASDVILVRCRVQRISRRDKRKVHRLSGNHETPREIVPGQACPRDP